MGVNLTRRGRFRLLTVRLRGLIFYRVYTIRSRKGGIAFPNPFESPTTPSHLQRNLSHLWRFCPGVHSLGSRSDYPTRFPPLKSSGISTSSTSWTTAQPTSPSRPLSLVDTPTRVLVLCPRVTWHKPLPPNSSTLSESLKTHGQVGRRIRRDNGMVTATINSLVTSRANNRRNRSGRLWVKEVKIYLLESNKRNGKRTFTFLKYFSL